MPLSTQPEQHNAGDLPANQEARRRKILMAARELIDKDEYDKIQIRDVAAAAGVALGTLYRYFKSKEHLYATVLFGWASPMGTNDPSWAGLSSIDRLTKRMDRALDTFARHPQIFKVSIMLQQCQDPTVRELARLHTEILDRAVMQDLDDVDEAEARDIAHMIWGTLLHMFTLVDTGMATLADTVRTMHVLVRLVRARVESLTADALPPLTEPGSA